MTSVSLRLRIAVVLPAPIGPVNRMTCSAMGSPPQTSAEAREEALRLLAVLWACRRDDHRWGLGGELEQLHEAERVDQVLRQRLWGLGGLRELRRREVRVAER